MQKNTDHSINKYKQDQTASLKELILSIKDWSLYFFSKWYLLLLFGTLGGALGFFYAFNKKPIYIATTSFVLDEAGKGGGLRAYAGLASSLGVDLGGGGGGLFEGENILELYKSRTMVTRALLSEAQFDEKKQLLIDRYISFNKLRKGWEKSPELKNLTFSKDHLYATPRQQLLHDSIMGGIVRNITQGVLRVEKKDKKLNIIYVTVTSKDQLFAQAFNITLVKKVNDFYLSTKTKKNLENVIILQAKTDSVRSLMVGSIRKAAVTADGTPNQNPTRMAQRIAPIQTATANVEVNKAVLGTLLQNLELSKISLLKETPLIQIVDEPILPLDVVKLGKIKATLTGGFISVLLFVFFAVVRRIIKVSLHEGEI